MAKPQAQRDDGSGMGGMVRGYGPSGYGYPPRGYGPPGGRGGEDATRTIACMFPESPANRAKEANTSTFLNNRTCLHVLDRMARRTAHCHNVYLVYLLATE